MGLTLAYPLISYCVITTWLIRDAASFDTYIWDEMEDYIYEDDSRLSPWIAYDDDSVTLRKSSRAYSANFVIDRASNLAHHVHIVARDGEPIPGDDTHQNDQNKYALVRTKLKYENGDDDDEDESFEIKRGDDKYVVVYRDYGQNKFRNAALVERKDADSIKTSKKNSNNFRRMVADVVIDNIEPSDVKGKSSDATTTNSSNTYPRTNIQSAMTASWTEMKENPPNNANEAGTESSNIISNREVNYATLEMITKSYKNDSEFAVNNASSVGETTIESVSEEDRRMPDNNADNTKGETITLSKDDVAVALLTNVTINSEERVSEKNSNDYASGEPVTESEEYALLSDEDNIDISTSLSAVIISNEDLLSEVNDNKHVSREPVTESKGYASSSEMEKQSSQITSPIENDTKCNEYTHLNVPSSEEDLLKRRERERRCKENHDKILEFYGKYIAPKSHPDIFI